MPHVLAGLQGTQVRKAGDEADGHGGPQRVTEMLELESEGSMNPAEYRRAVRDLVNFMVYLGDSQNHERNQA
jgi:ubiquinol-cytochrome c reductase cytochrome c1 subunit